MGKLLFDTIKKIKPLDKNRMEEKEKELNSLLKTPKGLGKLEKLAIRLEGIDKNYKPDKKMVLVMAADNGVEREKVSKSKRVITQYVVEAMLNGKSSINALGMIYNADIKVVDLGIDKSSDIKNKINFKGIIDKKIMEFGTNNISKEAAMTYEQAVKAIETGIEMVDKFVKDGYNLFATGEMGIGNTTTSSAILKVLTDLPIDEIVGYGSGIDDKTLGHKKNVIKKAIQVNGLLDFFEKSKNAKGKKKIRKEQGNMDFESKINFENFKTEESQKSIINVLAKVGGLDIAGMAGTYLGCAKNRVPVVIDGFISAVSALIAYKICPVSREFMIASHLSEEPGMKYIMKELNLEPMLFMNMKLGEGTGAVMMFPVIEGACNITKVVREYPDV
ncbi:nicotinate-nucleotide--dimethylbenzimidazole phosphoribosyltransferase [Leptotrichia sp. oral taxon 417]|uniref:nicotinate-nucleotide--dimethylbenzimidazole phosphoribosyltransferase n=1 Tax=Leptotrichia sp. oral taxon 417 TaxID=712365 RepID=UPI0015BB5D33|nr:nicotinate-nucleotide--dimethylbenzimidazole phosphoribosyltransferase [Leptotrichia sp. oral taxon 417]NWO26661.1 nicotinate-nucleotide--dimethylbenzimidazole phosphoribosyltransferase [Leptotrichia sp. oral taxon 417]